MSAPTSPRLVVLMGLPGTGKTTVAESLAHDYGLTRVCRDRIREAMFPTPRGGPAELRLAYKAQLDAVRHLLKAGRDVVVDGVPFARTEDRIAMRSVGEETAAATTAILLTCPPAQARDRVANDVESGWTKHHTVESVDDVLARFEPVIGLHYPVSTLTPQPAVLLRVLEILGIEP